jgi:hypothetical protein
MILMNDKLFLVLVVTWAGIYKEGRTFKVVQRRACQTESVDKILCPAAQTDRLLS